MNSETRECQNCKGSFVIEPEDFDFYKKISVPPPTFCPECRMIRRMTWRNERALYKRICGITGKDVISCFAPDSGITVYNRDAWWSDARDPFESGAPYDFTKPFFFQFRELLARTPMPSLFLSRATNSDYCNHVGEVKDCYLTYATWGAERVDYGTKAIYCKDSMDILATSECELCYECVSSFKLYNCRFVQDSEGCSDSTFLYQCKGCSHCFGCTNLRNKSYYIFNQPYAKEEYEAKLKEMDIGDYRSLRSFREKFETEKLRAVRKFANFQKTDNVTGDNVSNASNCRFCFDLRDEIRNCKFCVNGGAHFFDSYDGYGAGEHADLLYESVDTGVNGSRFLFDIFVWGGLNVNYSYASHGSRNMFGCIGLHNKEYCILNRQYTKEEYEALVPKIIEHMNEMPYASKSKYQNPNIKQLEEREIVYRYGEFFPPELSPFAYNETIAQEYFSLTKEETEGKGYRSRDLETREYTITKKPEELPDHSKDVGDDILNEVIGCAHAAPLARRCNEQCTTAFKIIPQELQFYRKMNLPLPRLCPNCRHYGRLTQRNPIKLWHRTCQCAGRKSETVFVYENTATHFHGGDHCPNEFETSYSPDRPEIVYCESCYNSEVV